MTMALARSIVNVDGDSAAMKRAFARAVDADGRAVDGHREEAEGPPQALSS